ncbi:hypothetical protein FNW02_03810 [Komarekiella sp. 'clone 1']|uniref:Uncharacterized protein n=1 Tax=Komarekiella delphini-convector SJRDD-AB1 TaxID=2593771 RepID=A0AA40VP67_9NOST|nr:hypothetical protein [Komarekiella delphini-convector]MBD6614999.1 hypothetical protein [Komarekiella delphini-convector SJRDD-AB1]
MNQLCLPPDDLPSHQTIRVSEILFRQLEEATKNSFFLACDKMTRVLLCSCHWYFQINSGILTLIMICHNMESYRNIMKTVPQFADKLKYFTNRAKITVSSPLDQGTPWILSIDNILPEEDLPTT